MRQSGGAISSINPVADEDALRCTIYGGKPSMICTPSVCTHCLSRTSNFGIAKSSRVSKTIRKSNGAHLRQNGGWELEGASGVLAWTVKQMNWRICEIGQDRHGVYTVWMYAEVCDDNKKELNQIQLVNTDSFW